MNSLEKAAELTKQLDTAMTGLNKRYPITRDNAVCWLYFLSTSQLKLRELTSDALNQLSDLGIVDLVSQLNKQTSVEECMDIINSTDPLIVSRLYYLYGNEVLPVFSDEAEEALSKVNWNKQPGLWPNQTNQEETES
jgi:hypothetical protein